MKKGKNSRYKRNVANKKIHDYLKYNIIMLNTVVLWVTRSVIYFNLRNQNKLSIRDRHLTDTLLLY